MGTTESAERYVGAYGLCRTDGAGILLVRVSDGSESGRWTLPGGGVEPLEHPDTTVAREFAEETGLTTASIGPVVGIYSHVRPADQTRLGRPFHHIGIVYRVEVPHGSSPRPERGGSTDECGWFTPHDLAQLSLASLARWAVPLIGPEPPAPTAEQAHRRS
jgi:ADP-ribose pyrophosphatase YjhB (NUDIX family)